MKKLCLFFLCLMIAVFEAVPVFATDEVVSGIAGETESKTSVVVNSSTSTAGQEKTFDFTDPYHLHDNPVTVEQLDAKLNSMGTDVIGIIKTVGRYICLGGFIVCIILLFIGIVGNPRLMARSAIGALCSGIMYMAITCGEQIVAMIAAWSAL